MGREGTITTPTVLLADLARDWRLWARTGQRAPAGNWSTWLIMAGRGFGKTRAGAEWVRRHAEAGPLRIALIAATLDEARAVMVEGPSGLMALATPRAAPRWGQAGRVLHWPSGATASLHSAASPESLRGPEFHIAWADELAKWPDPQRVWDLLQPALRLGAHPRCVVTTTPRDVPLLRALIDDHAVAKTRGATRDNRALPAATVAALEARYGSTRFGRQELDGELLTAVDGALWTRAAIEALRVPPGGPVTRVVIGVDPPASANGDACGIIVVGLDPERRGVVIEDASVVRPSPERWAAAVAGAAARHGADRIVAEANNGGAMVESVLRAADHALPVRLVHASRGKVARAEPVAALYERGRVRHAGRFAALEDELCGLVTGGGYHGPGRSPDRADALVWALSALMLMDDDPVPGLRRL